MDLAKFVAQVEQNRRELERKQRQVVDKFPAVLTATANGRYAWTEQTWSATGTRYTKPNGRSGTTTYMPAYPYGDGVGPAVLTLPVEVMLRRTTTTADFGPVYEFPWNCACAPTYPSGYGVPPDAVKTPCCDVLFPSRLFATFIHEQGPCSCVDGTVIPITFSAITQLWSGFVNLPGCGVPALSFMGLNFLCQSSNGVLLLTINSDANTGNTCFIPFSSSQPVTAESCDRPVLIVFPNIRVFQRNPNPCCGQGGATPEFYTVIISE